MRFLNNIRRLFRNNPMLITVNIPGLAIGLTAFLLLMLYVVHEMSYDRYFSNKDRVVRLYNRLTDENSTGTHPICLRKAYTRIPDEIPEIEAATQIYRGFNATITYNDIKLSGRNLLYADSGFFNVFGIELQDGDVQNALRGKNTVVISKTLAVQLFNKEPATGKVININDDDFTVTGIFNDFPRTTHFRADMIASMSTVKPESFGGLEFFTYFLLKKNTNFTTAGNKIAALNTKIVKDRFREVQSNLKVKSGVEKLTDLHLHTAADYDLSHKGNPVTIYIVAAIAFFILLIALTNHINLFVLHGEKRFSEIGIRKSLGADRKSIIRLFYFETAVITIIAFIIAFLLTPAALPYFSDLLNVDLSFSELLNPRSVAGIVIFVFLLILVSGAYPAMYLSRLKTISAVKGDIQTLRRKDHLSTASVLIQFFISVLLILSLTVVYSQVNFLKKIPLGFSPEKVIVINNLNRKIRQSSNSLMEELGKLPFISSVSGSVHSMGGGCSGQLITLYGSNTNKNWKSINEYRVHPGFGKTMGLQLVSGRFFDSEKNDTMSVILNQSAVKMLNIKDPVGKKVVMFDDPMTVIGVAKDFYYSDNAGEKIQPLVLTDYSNRIFNIYLKTAHNLSKPELQQIAGIFNDFDPEYSFSYRNVKDLFAAKFNSENRLIRMLLSGTLLAILLGFTGMYAMSVFQVERRTKEIGIRKVAGSTSVEIVIMLLRKMLNRVVWAMVPALLIGYILLKDWLTLFANKIDIVPGYFLFAGGVALLVAGTAVFVKSFTAARRNPVDSLRYE